MEKENNKNTEETKVSEEQKEQNNIKSDEKQTVKEEKKTKTNKSSRKSSSSKLKKELEEKTEELAVLKDKYLRLFAEFDNFKKRTSKEKLDLIKTASEHLLEVLLPVLDDFDRAKKSADDENTTEEFSEGVSMVYTKLYSVLKARGLNEMESTGQAFDPELHDAITEIPAPAEDMKGKIIDTIEKGYLLHDKIIRHAKVVVGK
jgi:molecular chaperone GrpE